MNALSNKDISLSMKIQNKRILSNKIKFFTLKATASAILTLNAETSLAASCSAEIFGDNPLCNFSTTSSVTVENGGTVAGIIMENYNPTPDSFLLVNSGGAVKTSTDISISIKSSSITNGISNNGTISSTSATGIKVFSHSNITGGISNTGVISTGALGLFVGHSSLTGNIFNSGTLSSNQLGSGIWFTNSSITGSILNSGTISGSGDDSGVSFLFNSSSSGDIVNSGLINADNGNGLYIHSNVTVSGGISNTGRIESVSQSGLSIDTVATVQNNVFNSGVINGGIHGLAIHNAATVSGSVLNSGTLNGHQVGLSIYSATTISGNVSNSGSIISSSTGLNVSSTSTITGGISNSGTIQGDINAINISSNSIASIDILGTTARIKGTVNATGTDVNITNGAKFTSEGSYTVNDFNIASNAVFNMANPITATALNNSGTLSVSNHVDSLTGDYTQNTGGSFQTTVVSTSEYGQLTVSNNADLTNSGDIYVQVDQNTSLRPGDVLSNVIGANALTSPTNGFNVSDNSYIWNFTALLNGSTGVNLSASLNPAASNVCQGAYCQGAVSSILGQIAAGNSLFSAYATLPTANDLQTAASQATPELTNENIQIVQLITRAVVDIVPMWSSLRGQSAGDATFYPPGKIWVKPYGASMAQHVRNTVNGFNASAYGAVIGKDIELNDWLLGAAFAGGGDTMNGRSVLSGQSIRSNAYQIMLYGAKQLPGQIYYAGQGLVGYERSDTSRVIPLYTSTANGSYNSWFTNIRAEAGWSTHIFNPNFVFTPEIDASYVFINQGRYQETGSPMDLSVASNNNSSLVLGAYGNGAYHLITTKRQQDLAVTGYVGIAGDVLNNQPQTLSTFVASGTSFSTFGVQFNGVLFRGGGGLVMTNQNNPWVFELNYDLQVGNNAYSGIGGATIKYKQ